MARSNEAKALGIKAGMPFFKMKQEHPDVTVFSSNYELYGEITDRVMSLVRKATPSFYRYSLDEIIDKVNRLYGSETVVLGSQQYTREKGKGKAGVFKDSIKHDFRSPCYTTRWSDIPEAE